METKILKIIIYIKKIVPIILLLVLFGLKGNCQTNYKGKFETGFLRFQNTNVQVDPGPDWKGYNLDNEQNGIDINFINGLVFSDKFFTGIGFGYLNFEGINGASVFGDFEYLPLKTKLTPLINLKVGYSHIWNQYNNGTGSELIEFGAGVCYKISEKIRIYLQSGIMETQQSFLIPIRIGISF